MNILIVEDEIHIANHLAGILGKITDARTKRPHVCVSLNDALDYLSKNTIDLLLLDLNLRGKDGFETLKFMVSQPFHVIVVSAHVEKAIEAFEYGVLDFVPKPFSESRLRKAFQRLTGEKKAVGQTAVKNFVVKKKNRLEIVKEIDVLYFEAYGHYSKINLRDGSEKVYDKPLIVLETLLDERYERVHKSYIVKMTEIKNIEAYPGGKYFMEMTNGKKVKIGRQRYGSIKEKWFN